uniref:Uncharacterized protein n=1 Tax=Tanacetum cinerariifolium TaxID=118510 RepID=A0A6L2MND3_TANCI|nr:hypothetical protein [Tanacetum cinerariifolium]
MQNQTSNTLHNAIMEAGSKDRPPMLAPGIDNDIYSTVDACPNACEMWKAIERLKQGESINVQDLETNLFWKFGKFTSQDESRAKDRLISQTEEPVFQHEEVPDIHRTLVEIKSPVLYWWGCIRSCRNRIWITEGTKDMEKGKIRLLIMHQLIWGFVMTGVNEGSVLAVTSSSNNFCPKKHRGLRKYQLCPSSLNESTVSSFDNAILLWSPGN